MGVGSYSSRELCCWLQWSVTPVTGSTCRPPRATQPGAGYTPRSSGCGPAVRRGAERVARKAARSATRLTARWRCGCTRRLQSAAGGLSPRLDASHPQRTIMGHARRFHRPRQSMRGRQSETLSRQGGTRPATQTICTLLKKVPSSPACVIHVRHCCASSGVMTPTARACWGTAS